MLSGELVASRRDLVAESSDLSALVGRLAARADRFLGRPLTPPALKALLTADGGVCPDDGSSLEFDPWRPGAHRCPRCGRELAGPRHDGAWARWQHLWLAERAAELAAVGVLADRQDAAEASARILASYAERYAELPNRDNVLGPSRLFFSTYLESIWVNNYLAAAGLLREGGMLDAAVEEAVNAVADEAANLIGEFDEGFSNRQTWHNAALAAIAVWFEDEELAGRAIEGPTGAIAHLVRGFGDDGMWYEGENYHLFALRGQLLAMGWARQAGVDILADPRLAGRLEGALRAPALTALPDFTFPARKDSRFGVSLAQPMYLELWEIGLARLGDPAADLWDWLRALYASPAPKAERFDSYLYDIGADAPASPRTRADLSWWALLEMAPELAAGRGEWRPGNTLLVGQGLAILRSGGRYASLECGSYGGGHGHPDRLHLTLHADGKHWLPDPGTGSYVARDLFWYRSTLAHNAPRLDSQSQPPGDAECLAFGESGDWAWARGGYKEYLRTVVAGPRYLIDVLELSSRRGASAGAALASQRRGRGGDARPLGGRSPVWASSSRRRSASFRTRAIARSCCDASQRNPGPSRCTWIPPRCCCAPRGRGCPTPRDPCASSCSECAGPACTWCRCSSPARASRTCGPGAEAETSSRWRRRKASDRHVNTSDGWQVTAGMCRSPLRGIRRGGAAAPLRPLIDTGRRTPMTGLAIGLREAPALDGTLDTFDFSEPLELDHEDQYRRSEEPYAGAEDFSAAAAVNWDHDAVYVAVEVRTPAMLVRDDAAPSLGLDNEPDDIHADGIQIYLRPAPERPAYGFLIVPSTDEGGIRVRGAAGTAGTAAMVRGALAADRDRIRGHRRARAAGLGPASRRADRLRSPGEPDASRAGSGGPASWCGAAAAAGSISAAIARTPPTSACSSCAEWIESRASPRPAASAPPPSSVPEGESTPLRMTRSSGCRVWDSEGREYLDYIMGLGAVALGYGHPEVTRAASEAVAAGVVGPLPPVLEEALAADLCRLIPWIERVRFLKTGAEAMAAAVRLARVFTGRDAVLGCGYHGWLDWCETREGKGVPAATRALYAELPFNEPEDARRLDPGRR